MTARCVTNERFIKPSSSPAPKPGVRPFVHVSSTCYIPELPVYQVGTQAHGGYHGGVCICKLVAVHLTPHRPGHVPPSPVMRRHVSRIPHPLMAWPSRIPENRIAARPQCQLPARLFPFPRGGDVVSDNPRRREGVGGEALV